MTTIRKRTAARWRMRALCGVIAISAGVAGMEIVTSAPAAAGAPSAGAVGWAQKEAASNDKSYDVDNGQCLLFVHDAYLYGGGINIGSAGSALEYWNAHRDLQSAPGDTNVPAGALVFWGATGSPYPNPDGHVGLSEGGDKVISSTEEGRPGVHEFSLSGRNHATYVHYPYLGWMMPPGVSLAGPPAPSPQHIVPSEPHATLAFVPGTLTFLLSLPTGTIVRDPGSGHSFLTTLQGWKGIPTGGDFLCFVAQGARVVNVLGLDKLTMDFFAGFAVCTPGTPGGPNPASASAPAGSAADSRQSVPPPVPAAQPLPPSQFQPLPTVQPIQAPPQPRPTQAPPPPSATQAPPAPAPQPPNPTPAPPPPTQAAAPPPPPSITASKGAYDPSKCGGAGCYDLSIAVHNFPTGTYTYSCHDNSGPGGADTVFYQHAVNVTSAGQSSWPGVFCVDSHPFTAYLVLDGYASNSVAF